MPVPNFARAMLIPITLLHKFVRPGLGLVNATGIGCVVVAIISALLLAEKFGADLDYAE